RRDPPAAPHPRHEPELAQRLLRRRVGDLRGLRRLPLVPPRARRLGARAGGSNAVASGLARPSSLPPGGRRYSVRHQGEPSRLGACPLVPVPPTCLDFAPPSRSTASPQPSREPS